MSIKVALLSNPRSTGNKSLLPRIRRYCAENPGIFHYEVEHIDQIDEAMATIARVRPRILVINGGDGTVQAALTELHLGGHFGENIPPVAVLPNGKTNLIALDLGAHGDSIAALDQIVALAETDFADHVVARELISLTDGQVGTRPVLGMFLGGAGLADSILYCRHTLYPTGLPNGLCHVLTAFAVLASLILRVRAKFLPPQPSPVRVSLRREGQLQGRFAFLIVTTLEKLLFANAPQATGSLRFLAVDQSPVSLIRALFAGMAGKLGRDRVSGVYVERGDEIQIDGDCSSVILDGEIFQARPGFPIVLRSTEPMTFLRLAA
jgi:diacylglycerol kinase family enzyme